MDYRNKHGNNPFNPGNQWFAYLYINSANQVIYTDFRDSLINFSNKSLRRYVIKTANLELFIRYYQLRLHPEALKHVIN